MTISELSERLQEIINQGCGNKTILIEQGNCLLKINGIYKDTHPEVEPNYYFIEPGTHTNQI